MANGIVRWNPMRDMLAMQNAMDRLFEQSWRPLFDDTRAGHASLALDIHEDERSYVLSTELPGVKADQINVRQEADYLVIEAETRDEFEQPQEGRRALVKERRYGRYSRQVRLPQNVDFENAEATYEDGILKLTLPKVKEAQPRTIQVRSNSQTPQMAAQTNGQHTKK